MGIYDEAVKAETAALQLVPDSADFKDKLAQWQSKAKSEKLHKAAAKKP